MSVARQVMRRANAQGICPFIEGVQWAKGFTIVEVPVNLLRDPYTFPCELKHLSDARLT